MEGGGVAFGIDDISFDCIFVLSSSSSYLPARYGVRLQSDLEIEVKSIRLKDSEAYVDQDDEVAEALQDNEMVSYEAITLAYLSTPTLFGVISLIKIK